MPTYSYEATDRAGRVSSGVVEAAEPRGAVAKLQETGLIPIRVTPTRSAEGRLGLNITRLGIDLFARISHKDVMLFTQDLGVLLEAGLPVDRALSMLKGTAENERFKDVIGEVLKAVQGGSFLSDALGKHPKAFSSFYVNMVRAGDVGGVLEAVLARLGVFMESSQDLRDYIKSALVYPIFLVLVGGISIIILMTFVIPKFAVIFADMGQAIPLPTQILLAISTTVRNYWWALAAAVVLLVLGFRRYSRRPSGRLKLDQRKLTLPLVGDLVRKVEVARFARTLGTLMRSGVPILQALQLVRAIMSNQIIAQGLDRIHERVKEGDRLSKPLEEAGLFPSLAIQMITVGEETGKLDEMLLKVAENYEKVVRNLIKRLISFLEPAMILGMGLVVGFIVISMLMAIFSVNEMPF